MVKAIRLLMSLSHQVLMATFDSNNYVEDREAKASSEDELIKSQERSWLVTLL